jgi:multimeric flavodoxin WrbA
MARTVVVYHSGYGHTKVVAEHVARGAQGTLVAIDAEGNLTEDEWALVNEADAIIFGTPTYMGNVSWQFKKFADATSKAWFTRAWQDKVFGGFTNSASPNGDKQVAMITLQTLASQHGGIWVSRWRASVEHQGGHDCRSQQSGRFGRAAHPRSGRCLGR